MTRSVPSSGSTSTWSFAGSPFVTRTSAARPDTRIAAPSWSIWTRSFAAVPLTVTASGWPSPALPVSAAARLASTRSRSVPRTSLTRTVSAPPSAFRSIRSTPSRSIVMLPTLRKNRIRSPLAETSNASAAPAPLNNIASSLPNWPSTRSLPSPGSQTNVSSPKPMKAVSSPRLPSARSSPKPPRNTSAPEPPTRESSPNSPLSVVASVSVKTPLTSSMRTESSPNPASTSIVSNRLRSNRASAEPSPSLSSSSVPGSPALRRSTIVSLLKVPLISRVSRLIFAFTFCWCAAAGAAVAWTATPRPSAAAAATTRSRRTERRALAGAYVDIRGSPNRLVSVVLVCQPIVLPAQARPRRGDPWSTGGVSASDPGTSLAGGRMLARFRQLV